MSEWKFLDLNKPRNPRRFHETIDSISF